MKTEREYGAVPALALFLVMSAGAFFGTARPAAAAEGWQAEWEKTVQAAEKEGEVTLYTLGDYGYVKEFEAKYPRIKVTVVSGRGSELLSRIMTERRAGKYLADVARIGNTSPFALYQAKVLQPIAPAFILPEVKDESKWWGGKHHYGDPEGKYIFVPIGSVSVNMVAYNTELVKPGELNSYWELLEPKWRGKIVAMDPRAGGYGRSGARFVYYNPELGPDFLKRFFTEASVTLSRDYRQAIDWLAQKKFSLLLFGNGDDVLEAKGQGLPVNVADTSGWKEGAAVEPAAFTVVLPDQPAHPNAARVFINWLLSREGQTAVQRDGETNDSLRVDIPKTDVREHLRRRAGSKYVVTWLPQWMDMKPIQKAVNEALGEAKK